MKEKQNHFTFARLYQLHVLFRNRSNIQLCQTKYTPFDAVAKDQPSQMAANEITRNLFFGDRILMSWSSECIVVCEDK